jgi:hypothetical protein
VRRWALGLVVTAVAVLVPAAPASAHPLGNFSVNQYEGLTLHPDRVSVTAVVNTAEVATQQDRRAVDTNSDGRITADERAAYAAITCRAVAAAFQVAVDGTPLSWSVTPGGYEYVAPDVTLPAARLTCGLTAPAALDRPRTVRVDNRYRLDRAGWHELTAIGDGVHDGVHLVDSPLPDGSVSDELRTRAEPSTCAPRRCRSRPAPGRPRLVRAHRPQPPAPGCLAPLRVCCAGWSVTGCPRWSWCSLCFSRWRWVPGTRPCPGTARRSWPRTWPGGPAGPATRWPSVSW